MFSRMKESISVAPVKEMEGARGKPSVGPHLPGGLESLAVVLAAEQAARMCQKVAVTTAVEEP